MVAFLKFNSMNKHGSEENVVFAQLHDIEKRIRAVNSLFSAVDNDDLIDAYVFELGSLEAKRSFLLKKAKELKIKRCPFNSSHCNESVRF